MQTHAKYIEDQINSSWSFLSEWVAQERRRKIGDKDKLTV